MLHPATWVVWTVVTATAITLTHNPLYLTILLGIVTIHYAMVSHSISNVQLRNGQIY